MPKPLGENVAYIEYTYRGPVLDLSEMSEKEIAEALKSETRL